MDEKIVTNSDLTIVVFYIFIVFILLVLILIVFFYFSRKKIINKEMEKRNLEVNYQKQLVRSMILTQEDERKRIAQDLHDDISSKLNIVSLNSQMLHTANLSATEFSEITSNIIDLTKKALENSRRIAHDLLPPVLERFGLNAAIKELIVEVESSKSVTVEYQNHLDFGANYSDAHLHVFRILQELINNSMRHGNATLIKIKFEAEKNVKKCIYSDNGIGFNIEDFNNNKGLGMKNIESRVNFLNGEIKINSTANNGVVVIFTF